MCDPKSILVVRLSSLGDVVMTLPAVYSLKKHFPHWKLHWVCEGSAYELLSCVEFVDETIRFPRERIVDFLKRGKILGALRVIRDFFVYMRKKEFDLIIDFHGILKSGLISFLSKKKRVIGFGKPYAKEFSSIFYDERVNGSDPFLHKVERNMLIVRHLKADESYENIPFRISGEDEEYIQKFFHEKGLDKVVFAINPFSSIKGAYKRWPLENYRILAERIDREIGANVIVLWGTHEEKKEAERLRSATNGKVVVSCPTNVPQLLALLGKVDMYIGGDSGVTHLASLAGTPLVAIFGPSDYRINTPYGPDKRIIRKRIACSPCKKRDCEDRKCLTSIEPEHVFHVVKSFYSEKAGKK
jgi:lipopolysaccharide heptosyltransferase I